MPISSLPNIFRPVFLLPAVLLLVLVPGVPSHAAGPLDAAFRKDFPTAFARLAGQPALTRTLVEWLYLKAKPKEAGFRRLVAFIDRKPNWPSLSKLRRSAEKRLFENRADSGTVLAYFKRHRPLSGYGMAALARAYLAGGDRKSAAKWIRRAWRSHWLAKKDELAILRSGLGRFISAADHKKRMNIMLYRRATAAVGLRAAGYLGRDYIRLANARLMLMKRSKKAPRYVAAVPARLSRDTGLLYNRIQYLRRKKHYGKSRSLLLRAPVAHASLGNPVIWWSERRVGARLAVAQRAYRQAYRIAAAHGFKSGRYLREGEFLAGWIALRFLKKPQTALKHFNRLRAAATTRRHMARGEYWLGRTYRRLGQKERARQHFSNAANNPLVYYGQLAINALGKPAHLSFPRPPRPNAAERRTFAGNELVRVIRLLAKTGYIRKADAFFSTLLYRYKSAGMLVQLANLADRLGTKKWVVRVGKSAVSRGLPLYTHAYPVRGLPPFPATASPGVEKAIVFGLIRQESEFDAAAGSRVGAQGLMQIMPGTARLIARKHGHKYSRRWLTSKPHYNVQLGVKHLRDLLVRFNGSYVMAIAGYNAGGGNVRRWARSFGDPRSGKVDPVDWIETIPFTETRTYVHHVLENIQVYRSRLGDRSPVRLMADLRRGGGIQSLINRVSAN